MAEPIEVAYVEIRPDVAGFGRDLRSDLKREIALAERSAVVDVKSRVTGGALKGARADLGVITASTATLGKSSALAAGAVGGLAGRLATLGAAGGAAAGIAAVGLALKSTADAAIAFEDSFAGVVKTVGGDPLEGGATAAELEALAGQFRAMAREIPISVNEINAIGEAAGALGIKKEGIVEFTDTVAKLGVTTDLSSDAAADALARIGNITNLPSDQFDNLASSIVALGNSTASTESEIVEFTQRLSGAGATIGLSQGEIAGFGAALASAGVEAEAGGTAFSTLFVKIARSAEKGGKSIEGFANVAGLSGKEFQKQFAEDPAQAIVRFIQGLSKVDEAGGSTFGTLEQLGLGGARIRQSLLNAANAQEVFASAVTTGNKAFKENSALSKEAGVRFGTTASQIQIFKNNVNDLQIAIGKALLPAINETVGGLARFVNALRTNEALADALKEVFGLIGGAISEVASVFQERGDDIKTAMRDIAVVIQRSVTLAVAVLKPLIAIFTFGLKNAINNSITILKVFAKAWRGLSDVIVKVIGTIITVLDKFLGGIAAMADAASHIPFVGDKFKGVSDKINESRETLRNLNDELKSLDGKVVNATVQVTVRTITQRPTGIPGGGTTPGINLEDIPPETAPSGKHKPGDWLPIIPRTTHKGLNEKQARKISEDLQADVEEARLLDESTANDKRALRALIAFSKEQATNANLKAAVRREFYFQQLQAQADLRSIYQAEGDAAQAAADEAQAAADERERTRQQEKQNRIQERESTLRTNLEIARLSVKNLNDDRVALRALIAFYKERIRQVGAYTAAGRQYLLAKKQATAELKGLAAQERADRKEEREARLDAEGERLADRRTLAELTRKTLKDDEAAIRAEIAYFRKRKNMAKKGSAERRKWLIEERRAQNDLADLLEERKEMQEKSADAIKTAQFEFLQAQQGFAGNLMSNLIGFGVAGGLLTTAAEAAPAGATPVTAGDERDATGLPRTPGANLTQAQAAREDRRGLTQGQAEQLITIQRQMLNVLSDIRRGSSAPEAKGAALAARHSTEII